MSILDMANILDINQQFEAWVQFVEYQRLSDSVRPLIGNSWKRCWARMNPYQQVRTSRLSSDHLLAAQINAFSWISLARPIMEDIYQAVEQSDTALVLVNSAGYILDMIGDPEILELTNDLGISVGGDYSESRLGTNALGLALTERIPLQVSGAEHYLKIFHDLAESAAPIFDVSGRPLGAMGVITPVDRHSAHTLGLAVAGARAIEGQQQAEYLLAEQHSHLAQMNAILEANSDGVLVWDAMHTLTRINHAAVKILDLPVQSIIGKRIEEFIIAPPYFQEVLEKLRPINNVELTFRVDGKSVRCLVSLRFITTNRDEHWTIASLKPEMDVRQLVQYQVGTQAYLALEDLPGESAEMRRIYRIVRSAASAQASILIRGESGTGKNLLANAIHNESLRREGPFFIFACSSIPNELVISELLGYDAGFSSKRPGGRPSKFELAQGGTLYFQDIDALPLEAQAVLLNVLDLGIVHRLGSDHPIPVDVRIIASSSGEMEKLIAQGNFRADLFYRLGTFEITLPPLRDRKKDLALLTDRILKRLSRQHNRPLSLAPEVIELFKKYQWPGNIRELEAVLGRAVLQAGVSEIIGPMHLPESIRFPTSEEQEKMQSFSPGPLVDVERQLIMEMAQHCGGNVTQMASMLGIGRTTLWRKMKEFNITAKDFKRNWKP